MHRLIIDYSYRMFVLTCASTYHRLFIQDVSMTILSHRYSGHHTYYTIKTAGLHEDGYDGVRTTEFAEHDINALYIVQVGYD